MVGSEKRRGRKRKIKDVENVTVDGDGRRKIVETRSKRIVGRYVMKEFEGSGVFLGKVASYYSGLYRIDYEDGDCEDLESGELKVLLVEDSKIIGEWLERKKKLDELLLSKDVQAKNSKFKNAPANATVDNKVEALLLSEPTNGGVGAIEVEEVQEEANTYADGDSSSDSCEDAQEQDASLEVEEPVVPPPELPLSSGHIGVPEEYVSHLFSVYSVMRSFSAPLFLYPFGLDDFVGALNCSVANTLLDSVHVALMSALKRHIERLSSEGSELASKCLRCIDWSLLDSLTWPVYLVHYLMVMRYTDGPDWKGFYAHTLERDYYTLSVGRKLLILQILCDDILDSEELRVDIDMREALEVGIDTDTGTMVAPAGGPRRVHPRYSKTSACKDKDAIQIIAECHEIKPSLNSHSLGSEISGPVESSVVDQDGNGDECRLCGMDGLLLCCDGCPSSYHSRCLGLCKMYMPEGPWFCPECKINATGLKTLRGTALRAGENFGVDCYEQVFVGTCDHLLVLKASINSEVCLKYYHRHDIPRVLQALHSKVEHVTIYSNICQGILQYWEMPEDILPRNRTSETDIQLADHKESSVCATHLASSVDKLVPESLEVENTGSCETISSGNLVVSSLKISFQDPMPSGNFMDTELPPDLQGNSVTARKQSNSLLKPRMTEPAIFTGSVGQAADCFELSQQSTSSISEVVSHGIINCREPVSGTLVHSKVSLPCEKLKDGVDTESCRSSLESFLYTGSSFKMQGYINYYLHGEFAASAAANLAVLSSEESQVPESRSLDNHKKVMSASVSLQVKAFSSAAMRFFWPITEKKLLEVPRERCSWCFCCKAQVTSKRGCLLNAAASNTTKGALKALTGLRSVKNGEGSLPGISAYVLFMEESLGGLIVGPFLNDTFRKRWHKQIEQATNYNAVKILMLELEENIRTIALSGDWVKLVDDCSTESSASQSAASATGSTQKRRPGRRGRKPSVTAEVATDSQDLLSDFTWWRGGTLSKRIFQRGILPCSMVKKAARQGGYKRIPGIHYVEGYETPKRSRQLVWRSAVEMCRNAAQLALQVRYLDFHVRWSDLVRPEQISFDGKGPETEASAFRNAFICGKKNTEHEIRYCVAFGSQKHLPSRVMKSITEIEQSHDGRERYWFSETQIPLYLIKEYEESVEKDKPVDVLSKLQRKQLMGSRKNIFSYLLWKRDNMDNFYCSSCHQNVLFRNAVKCSACQGLCHQQCVTSSTIHVNEEVEFVINCKQCYQTRALTRTETYNASPRSPLLLQGRDILNTAANKHGKQAVYNGLSASIGTVQRVPEVKSIDSSVSVNKGKKLSWGLIWRKKNCEDNGIDFRLKNILLKGNPHMDLARPDCRLCNQPYNSDLMYIRCETCQHWFHADSVELDESKIFEVVGFKCCKCRRLRSPVCPYLPPEKKAALEKKMMKKVPKQEMSRMGSDSSVIPAQAREEAVHVPLDDPLLVSLSGVEQLTEDKLKMDRGWINATVSEPGPRKLPVRRHIKQENDANCSLPTDSLTSPLEVNVFNSTEKLPVRRHIARENNVNCSSATYSFHVQPSTPFEANTVNSVEDSFSPLVEWDVSNGGFDDAITLDYDCLGFDDTEFEPQTYFSFNELLDSEDAGGSNGAELPEIPIENWENSSAFPQNEVLEISYDNEEPMISVETDLHIPCKICSHSEPFPDLSCQICGVCIHSHCSPWDKQLPQEDGWRCGNCREWR